MSKNLSPEARERKRQYGQERYAELRALGICPKCGITDAARGRVMCRPCLKANSVICKNRKQKAAASGTKCHHCASRRRVPGLKYCSVCRKKNMEKCRDYYLAKRFGVAA